MGWRLAALVVASAVAAQSARAQTPLAALLSSADRYVARYSEQLSNIVAEEHYTQNIVSGSRLRIVQPGVARPHRELKSDVLVVRVGPPLEWRPFRDVFEVDGKPVRDRDDRLTKLFLQPASTAAAQALRIARESARFNIGSIDRTLNAPGLSLAFLQSALQPKFHFDLDKRDGAVGPHVWIVKYTERARPTLFTHNRTQNNPTSGRFWIDDETGVVAKAELGVSPTGLNAKFTTSFRPDDRFGVALPNEMAEEYFYAGTALSGKATYTNFRRFEVTTGISSLQ